MLKEGLQLGFAASDVKEIRPEWRNSRLHLSKNVSSLIAAQINLGRKAFE